MFLPTTAQLAARHRRIHQALESLELDALIVTSAVNIRYLTNFAGSAGVLIFTHDDAHLLVDFRYREAVQMLQTSPSACPDLHVHDVPASYDEALLECVSELKRPSAYRLPPTAYQLGFEAGHVTVAKLEWWRTNVETRQIAVALRPTERVVEQLRIVKDESEIAALREAAHRLDVVADAAFKAATAGRSERQVAGAIEHAMREAGYERPAFETIVASGPHGALPHHRAGERILAGGDLVVLDFGGVLDGYCSDLTRTVSIGPPSPEARRLYSAVYDAQQAAIAAVRPGAQTTAVDAAARQVLEDRGLGAAFGHGTGHGLGLDIHEEPRLTRPRADVPPVPLEPGMVFTIEPGAYLAGFGGTRIEDDVLVTETGCEVLTRVTRELRAL